MSRLTALTAFLLATPAPYAALAQTQAPSPDVAGSVAATTTEQVVVTANRSAAPVDQVGQQVTVLTLPQIRLDQETGVADMLARTPGVVVTRNGGPGETTALDIRGADSDQTVVLIDGVKVNDPSDVGAGYDFANLLTGDVSRIEVLRGPQSTLYGSEAIGGVVNIITNGATRPLQGDVQAEGGSYGTAYVRGGIGGKDGPATFRLGAYYNSTDGVSAFDRAFGGREDDGFHTAGASGRFTYDLAADVQFEERAYYTWSRAEFDGYDTPVAPGAGFSSFGDDDEFGRTQQVVDYTGLNVSTLGGRLKNRFAYEYNELDRRNEEPDGDYGGKSTFDGLGRSNTFDYEATFAIAPDYNLVFGAQDEKSSFSTDSYGGPATKANVSIASGYGQITGQVLPNLTLTGGVRYDAQSTFGDHVTGQASAAYVVRPGAILRASFGQGFKAPSLYQLYSPYGALSLRPEEANGWDAGVEQHLFADRLTLSATYFGRKTTNLIDFVVCASADQPGCTPARLGNGGFYDNVAKTEAEGVELQADWKATDALAFTGNYTFDDDEDRSHGSLTRGDQLARRPKSTANLSASYLWPVKLRTIAAVRYAGRSFDDAADTVLLKSYTLLDLRASYPLRETLELYARVENLTDKHYETTYQYGTLGRAGYAGVRVSF
jgi:vitamin B12 transporter